jgi:lipid II:glycine glycyltransferase (peptidoglycan interpeptide bridge formation enzyme)
MAREWKFTPKEVYMKIIRDPQKWDEALLGLPAPHVLQSWTWGAFKSHAQQAWQPTRFLWREGTHPMSAAQVLIQRRSFLRGGLVTKAAYVPKGPILDWGNVDHVTHTLEGLENYARSTSLLFLKMDPDVSIDTPQGQAVLELLERRGWRPSFEQIQFRNTMVLDLRPDEETLLANMKSKWRYNVRLANRRGVKVRQVTEEEFPALYEMYAETSERNAFIIREASYYLEAWRAFSRAGLAIPLVAEVKEALVAMLVLFHFGQRAWYMYGASRDAHRKCMPNHLLQWEAIKRAKALGCTSYDMWGAPDVLNEEDPMWGVYRFKEGFGASLVRHIGAYDYAPSPILYRLYAFIRPRFVAWAQRRYWTRR